MVDLAGQRFGRLLVAEMQRVDGVTMADCSCDCGNTCLVVAHNLRRGATKSCGCVRQERGRETVPSRRTHGQTESREYETWCRMIQRCTNPNADAWPYYGGRGITVCDRWRHSFENFFADMGTRPQGMTIDRIDPDGNYEPSNCRWATWSEQRRNQRRELARA